jgi:hypothetical protein
MLRPALRLPLALLVLWTAGCDASGGAPVDPGGEDEPFGVISRYPGPSTRGVPVTAVIEVGFNGIIDPTSVGKGSLLLEEEPVGTVTVEGSKLRFTPWTSLVPGSKYTVVLAPTVRADDGHLLGTKSSWSFKTAGAKPPADTTGPDAPRPR